MAAYFADTSFWMALSRKRDQYHQQAGAWKQFVIRTRSSIVTTEAVLWEWLNGWPRKLLPICDWGCFNESAIDCSTPEGEVVDLPENVIFDMHMNGNDPPRKGMTFARWMEAWVDSVDLWPYEEREEEEEKDEHR